MGWGWMGKKEQETECSAVPMTGRIMVSLLETKGYFHDILPCKNETMSWISCERY
jgi:hypothetical protein